MKLAQRRTDAIVAVSLVACIFVWGACAELWSTPQALYAARQDACIAEAGTRAQADDCRCRVRQAYPNAPQCTALADGGWALPDETVLGATDVNRPKPKTARDE